MSGETAKKLLEALGMLALIVLGSIFRGVAICSLWEWFVVSHFGVQPLTLVAAMGLGLFVGYLASGVPQRKMDDSYLWTYIIHSTIVYPFVAVFVGWIIQLFL